MLTLENYDSVAFALASIGAVFFLAGLLILKPSSGITALPARNRLGFIFIMLGIIFACLTALAVAVCHLQPLLVPT